MEDTPEKVIMYQAFDTLINASLAKAKLDAYGIPCFLTEENLIYPFRNDNFSGVRLHIFETDTERVKEILLDEIS